MTIRPHARDVFYFDGGCRPNPGPIEVAVVSRGQSHFRDDLGSGDNNTAEWLALIFALDLALAAGASDVLFIGDSALVVEQASDRWPCRSLHLQPLANAFREAAAAIPRARLRRVPRSKNLAGIALERRRAALPQRP